ncbi:MAG: transcriptional regulator [Marinobacter sp. T13-3]|nr:MAG: transcriptional regulator [Marinobacter sp. T13-3]
MASYYYSFPERRSYATAVLASPTCKFTKITTPSSRYCIVEQTDQTYRYRCVALTTHYQSRPHSKDDNQRWMIVGNSNQTPDPNKLRPRQTLRFAAFDCLLYWERSVNTRLLAEYLATPQDTIKQAFTQYRSFYSPHDIIYDSVAKRFHPSATFHPKFTLGTIQEYVALIERYQKHQSVLALSHQPLQWLDHGPSYHHQPDPLIFANIIRCIREQKPIQITYASWQHPEGQQRVIHPHAVAQSHNRWHCRAFDDFHQEHRDFNLGRISNPMILPDRIYVDGAKDRPWNTIIAIRLAPNPDLSPSCQAMIEREYNMDGDHELKLRCRLSMAQYVIQSLPVVDPRDPRPENPMKQYLVVKNPGEIEAGLF